MLEQRIDIDSLCRTFRCESDTLPQNILEDFNKAKTAYREASLEEYKEYILSVLKLMDLPKIVRNREENIEAFEKGWRENLDLVLSQGLSSDSLKPKYFRENKFLRYNKKLIVSDNLDLEYDLFTLCRYLIFYKYLRPYKRIYELGCGSCQNLYLLAKLFPEKEFFGLDWTKASLEIADTIAKLSGKNIKGNIFDMMNPDDECNVEDNSAIITIHALEQIGEAHGNLIDFIMKSKPALVINYEPIIEFYDDTDVIDYLALKYSRKRNYLSGYYSALKQLEADGKIEIIDAFRPYIGGVIHEASLIVWRPIN